MHHLVLHPTLGLCVAEDYKYIPLADAMRNMPEVANQLMNEGNIESAIFEDGMCYTGVPQYTFYIDTDISYPDEFEQACVKDAIKPFHGEIVSRQFGCYTCVTYCNELYVRIADMAAMRFPDWKCFLPKPVPEQAVLDEEAIKNALLTEPEEWEPGKTTVMVKALAKAVTEPREVKPVVEPPVEVLKIDTPIADPGKIAHIKLPVDTSIDLSALVPEECRGETWAFTDEDISLAEVTDDGYCIENNWEDRGPYWIIDCPVTGVRLIHSDALSYNHEFKISECSE